MTETSEWNVGQERRIRALMERPWWRLRFPEDLEARFDAEVAETQTKMARNNHLLALFVCCLFAIGDYYFLPDVYRLAWVIRFLIIAPLFLFVISTDCYAKRSFRNGVATVMLMLVITVGLIYPVISSKSPDVEHYHVGLLLIVLFSNIMTDVRFPFALAASLVFSLLYLLEIAVWLALPTHLVGNYAMLMFFIVSMSLIANHRREHYWRQSFLMQTLLEIAEMKQVQNNSLLQDLAGSDPLTGLSNRRRFDQEYPRLWKDAMRTSRPISILFCDIDHFKAYNDTYGHASGDEVLKRFADLLRAAAKRPLDLVVRNGGEEFLVVLPNTSPEVAELIARDILDRLAGLAIPNEGSVHGFVTASVGVSGGVPFAEEDMQSYIDQADLAMYKAKRRGRNRIEYSCS